MRVLLAAILLGLSASVDGNVNEKLLFVFRWLIEQVLNFENFELASMCLLCMHAYANKRQTSLRR